MAEILSRWTKTKELVSNLIIEYADGLAKNEIDMVVNTGSKLVFVECKTAVFDIKDIDKFHNVAKLCGGLGAKAILITFHKPNARILEKCADNHMLTFWFHDRITSYNVCYTKLLRCSDIRHQRPLFGCLQLFGRFYRLVAPHILPQLRNNFV